MPPVKKLEPSRLKDATPPPAAPVPKPAPVAAPAPALPHNRSKPKPVGIGLNAPKEPVAPKVVIPAAPEQHSGHVDDIVIVPAKNKQEKSQMDSQ
jgi:hypothetical protein